MSKLTQRLNEWADRVTGAAFRGTESVQSAAKNFAKRRELAARGVEYGDHKQASAHLEKGRRYYNEKKFGRAAQYFQKAVDHDNRYALAYYYRGLALYKLEDLDAAVKSWRRVLDLEPDSDIGEKANKRLRGVKGKMMKIVDRMESSQRHS